MVNHIKLIIIPFFLYKKYLLLYKNKQLKDTHLNIKYEFK